jgi:hypothetical protein
MVSAASKPRRVNTGLPAFARGRAPARNSEAGSRAGLRTNREEEINNDERNSNAGDTLDSRGVLSYPSDHSPQQAQSFTQLALAES